MFICRECKRTLRPGISPIRVATKTRDKVYPKRYHAEYPKVCIDEGGYGKEIVTEVLMCRACVADTAHRRVI